MAEGVGFEPTNRLPGYTLSKRAPSATRPPLQQGSKAPAAAEYKDGRWDCNCPGGEPVREEGAAGRGYSAGGGTGMRRRA